MPTNLSLDPASNLWPTTSSSGSNMFTQQTPSSDASSTNPPTTTNDANFSMNTNFFAQNGSGVGPDLPKQDVVPQQDSNGNVGANMNSDGGDTFMGVQAPGSSGIGINGWKWTVMSGEKS